jgi:hypothetical protein
MALELHHGEKLGRARICQAIVDRSPRTRGWWTDDGPTDQVTAHLSGERLASIRLEDHHALERALSVWTGACALTVDELLGADLSLKRRALLHLWAAIGAPWKTDQEVAYWFHDRLFHPLERPVRLLLLRWDLIQKDPLSVRRDAQPAAGDGETLPPVGSPLSHHDWRWRWPGIGAATLKLPFYPLLLMVKVVNAVHPAQLRRWAVPVLCSAVAVFAAREHQSAVVASALVLGAVWIAWHWFVVWWRTWWEQ